jgi:hypothetical protein
MLNIDLDASSSSLTNAINSNSFPVDVVVFIRVEPSIKETRVNVKMITDVIVSDCCVTLNGQCFVSHG